MAKRRGCGGSGSRGGPAATGTVATTALAPRHPPPRAKVLVPSSQSRSPLELSDGNFARPRWGIHQGESGSGTGWRLGWTLGGLGVGFAEIIIHFREPMESVYEVAEAPPSLVDGLEAQEVIRAGHTSPIVRIGGGCVSPWMRLSAVHCPRRDDRRRTDPTAMSSVAAARTLLGQGRPRIARGAHSGERCHTAIT
jgi:hypothetical protein